MRLTDQSRYSICLLYGQVFHTYSILIFHCLLHKLYSVFLTFCIILNIVYCICYIHTNTIFLLIFFYSTICMFIRGPEQILHGKFMLKTIFNPDRTETGVVRSLCDVISIRRNKTNLSKSRSISIQCLQIVIYFKVYYISDRCVKNVFVVFVVVLVFVVVVVAVFFIYI